MKKTIDLVLVEASGIEFTSKETGEKVKKFKYNFFDKNNEIVSGYLDTDEYLKEVQDVSAFDEKLARPYPFAGRIWDGKIQWRLISRKAK